METKLPAVLLQRHLSEPVLNVNQANVKGKGKKAAYA